MNIEQYNLLESFSSDSKKSIENHIHDNLALLLNTRRKMFTDNLIEKNKPLLDSLLCFGIPDFNLVDFTHPQAQDNFCQVVSKAIYQYEPRLSNISVSIINNDQVIERCLKIKIEAMIKTNHQPASFELEVKP